MFQIFKDTRSFVLIKLVNLLLRKFYVWIEIKDFSKILWLSLILPYLLYIHFLFTISTFNHFLPLDSYLSYTLRSHISKTSSGGFVFLTSEVLGDCHPYLIQTFLIPTNFREYFSSISGSSEGWVHLPFTETRVLLVDSLPYFQSRLLKFACRS